MAIFAPMKRIIIILSMMLGAVCANAQVKSLYAEARLGYQEGFVADYVNVYLEGNIIPNLSYCWRQRFNKAFYNPTIPLNAADLLYIQWDITPKIGLQGGKIAVSVGGYEYDAAPIDLYYWDAFAGGLADVYALGGNFIFRPNPNQTLMLQVSQSLLGFGYKDVLHAAIVWYGHIAPWWKTIYTLNWMDNPTHVGLGIIGLGNRFEAGPFALELDFQYRTPLRYLAADYSAIAKVELSFPYVTVFAKGGYTYNWDCPIDVMPERYSFIYGGGGVEVFPIKNSKDLRIHAVGWWNTDVRRAIVALGLTYRFRFIK